MNDLILIVLIIELLFIDVSSVEWSYKVILFINIHVKYNYKLLFMLKYINTYIFTRFETRKSLHF